MKPGLGIAIVLLASVTSATVAAEELTIALSTQKVEISSNFAGGEVTLFGVIEPGVFRPGRPRGYDIVVTLLGPPENVVVRRKDRVLGVWVNRASKTVGAPSFYALRSSAPTATIAEQDILRELALGLDNFRFAYQGRVIVKDPLVEEFRQAYLRLKSEAGLFTEAPEVAFIGDSIFRTTVSLPANIPVGRYTALVHLFSGGVHLAKAQESLSVIRIGTERLMFDFSRNQSLIYGLISVALALFIGWLGGVIFRRD